MFTNQRQSFVMLIVTCLTFDNVKFGTRPLKIFELKMAKVVLGICFALTCYSQVVFSNVLDNLLNDVDQCKEVCDKTYSVHTYPNVSIFV